MNIDEYKKMLITNIKKDYLYDLNFEEGKELSIEDIIDLSEDLKLYMEEHEQFKNNVLILLKKISEIMNTNSLSNYMGQMAVNNWYIKTIRELENCYREFVIACAGNIMSNDDIYQISVKKSVLDVIEKTYEFMTKANIKKASIR